MNDLALIGQLLAKGHVTDELVRKWSRAAALLAGLDAIGRDGSVVLIKVDGARSEMPYSVVISGQRLGDSFFRKDGGDVLSLMQEAIEFYDLEVWSK
ncbi:MAG TPA: hypothetical protein VIM98_14110 [Dyella sp.]|uniref:hypothetical protein n=1 Tax=Dyella sp. TaxID=1869338 RepID=UPI002F929EEF